ncbi:fimbrial protein [Acinetobacter sp. ESL0695]|uniref:fimbrial protein n=1 Tax=Acinetobacter sp. ESL0695 TaxID=2983215 RepID=UPI0023F08E56|nr:fimbrial protein [Acinetobacter sp. ESL0695]WEV49448.1 fimbrial protein [Acinetobacter sp. ESL0695]
MSIIRYIQYFIFILFASFINQAYAACAPYTWGVFGWTGRATVQTVSQNIALGRIVVKPSDAIGQVLKEQTYTISPNGSYLSCNFYRNSFVNQGELSQRRPISNLGNNIYSTNLRGIGIRISLIEDGVQTNFPFSTSIDAYFYYFPLFGYNYSLDKTRLIKVEIIKTENDVESGGLSSGRYAVYYTDTYRNKPILTVDLPINGITVASSSCLITNNNTTIKLADAIRSGFNGVGSIQGEQNFQVNVLCNGGYNITSYNEQNQIGVNFNYTASAYNTQAIKNTSNNSPASGVDLQLLWSNNNEAIRNNYNYTIGSIVSNDTQTYEMQLKARYIQTQEQIKPGQIQGLATITINYK